MKTQYETHQRFSRDYDVLKESHDVSIVPVFYRSSIGTRAFNLQRPKAGRTDAMMPYFGAANASLPAIGYHQGYRSNLKGLASTIPVAMNAPVGAINAARERDKHDLVVLNDKFAQYVEKLRFLEAQNRKFKQEIEALKLRAGKTSSHIKEMYDIEIAEAAKLVNGMSAEAVAVKRRRNISEDELKALEDRYNHMSRLQQTDRNQIDALQQQIAENEAQIALLRRRLADIEDESRLYKNENQRLASEINRLQSEIQCESLLKGSCELDKAQAEDELAALKQIHGADLAEIRSRNISSDLDPSQFFRNELASAIQQIRDDYELSVENHRQSLQLEYALVQQKYASYIRPIVPVATSEDLETSPMRKLKDDLSKVQTGNSYIRTENKSLDDKIADIRRQLQDIRDQNHKAQNKHVSDMNSIKREMVVVDNSYRDVTTLQTNLQREIADYRELLEGQNGLRPLTERIERAAAIQGSSTGSISRTYINRGSSSSSYKQPVTTIGTLVNDSNTAPSVYQRFSTTSRRIESPDSSSNYVPRERAISPHLSRDINPSNYSSRMVYVSEQTDVKRTSHINETPDSPSYSRSKDEYEYQRSEEYDTVSNN